MQSVSGLTTSAVVSFTRSPFTAVLILAILRYTSVNLGGFMGDTLETLWALIISATAASLLP